MEKKNTPRKQSQVKEVWRRLKKNKSAILGLVLFSFFLFLAIFGELIIPYSKSIDVSVLDRMQRPNAEHWFGTDNFGRDVLARCVHAAKYSILIGVVTSFASAIVGTFLGAVVAYFGGWVDTLLMRFMDVVTAVPTLLLTLVVVASLGASVQNLIIAIAIANVPGFCRSARANMMGVSNQEFIEAARAYGATNMRVMRKYIIPNAIGPVIVQTTMAMSGALLAAASMSYLGLGIKPPTPEWGGMLNAGKEFIRKAPYLLYFPGLSIVLASLGINLLGDGLRDALDPKLKD